MSKLFRIADMASQEEVFLRADGVPDAMAKLSAFVGKSYMTSRDFGESSCIFSDGREYIIEEIHNDEVI